MKEVIDSLYEIEDNLLILGNFAKTFISEEIGDRILDVRTDLYKAKLKLEDLIDD